MAFSNKDTVLLNPKVIIDAVWEYNEGRHQAKRRRRKGRGREKRGVIEDKKRGKKKKEEEEERECGPWMPLLCALFYFNHVMT